MMTDHTPEPEARCPTCQIGREYDGPHYPEMLAKAGKPMCPDPFHDYAALSEQPAPTPPEQEEAREREGAQFPKERARVSCSQFAQCRWQGYRMSDRLGVQPDPCPRCGREVVR